MELVLNNLKMLICYKTKTTNQPVHNISLALCLYIYIYIYIYIVRNNVDG